MAAPASPGAAAPVETTIGGGEMELGKPERVYTVEPIRDPVPLTRPDETPNEPERRPEPEKVPVENALTRTGSLPRP